MATPIVAAAASAAARVSVRFIGMQAIEAAFDQILENAVNQGEWYVASAAEYGEVLEWNTPHWRVAIQSIADDATIDTSEQTDYLNAMVAGGQITKKVAEKLKSRIRRLIRDNGLIDTGNYIGSIAIGPSVGEALINSEDQLIDKSTSIIRDN